MLFVAPFALLLTACGAPSVNDLVEDPELLAETAQKCSKLMAQGKNADTEECKNAQLAQKKIIENMTKGIMNQ